MPDLRLNAVALATRTGLTQRNFLVLCITSHAPAWCLFRHHRDACKAATMLWRSVV